MTYKDSQDSNEGSHKLKAVCASITTELNIYRSYLRNLIINQINDQSAKPNGLSIITPYKDCFKSVLTFEHC